MYIWDMEKDKLYHYDFLNKNKPNNGDIENKDSANDSSAFVQRYD